MRNYVIINGVNSLTIPGLAIKALPPITKPLQRTLREEIDGRDGDIITELGYGAYDKTITIGLFGTFNIDDVIAFFNQKGTITFSNESDKVYYFQALDQVDYESLLKFREADIELHCQPFKYPTTETPLIEEYEYVTGTGETITLNNTEETTFNEINLKGNTKQFTTTGKNLFDSMKTGTTKNGVTFTPNSDGSITVTGTATSGINIVIVNTNNPPVLEAGTYTRSVKAVGTITKNNNYVFLTGRNSTNDNIMGDLTINGNNTMAKTSTLTGTNTMNGIGFFLSGSGAVFDCTLYIQLEKNSSDTEWEPYTGGVPAPNPNYPEAIQVVSGSNQIIISGEDPEDTDIYNIDLPVENLFNKNDNNSSNEGTTLTVLDTGVRCTITTAGTNKYSAIKMSNSDQLLGKTLTISASINCSASNDGLIRFYWLNNNSLTDQIARTLTSTGSATFIVPSSYPSGSNGIAIVFSSNASGASNVGDYVDYTNIMLEVGSKANSYTPFGTTPIEMCKSKTGNYYDYFYKNDGNWYKYGAIGKTIYVGASGEAWNYYQGIAFIDNSNIKDIGEVTNTNLFSNLFLAAAGKMYIGHTTHQRLHINLPNEGLSDITSYTAWKTWLSTHNLTIYYIQNETSTQITYEPLIEQLDAILEAKSKQNQTNITQVNNDLPFILDLSAFKLGSDVITIPDNGNIYSKPTIKLEGTGTVNIYLNDIQAFTVDLSEENEITIDTEKMEAYTSTGLANRKVTGDYSKFKLQPGNNEVRFSGDLTKATITRYTRWV